MASRTRNFITYYVDQDGGIQPAIRFRVNPNDPDGFGVNPISQPETAHLNAPVLVEMTFDDPSDADAISFGVAPGGGDPAGIRHFLYGDRLIGSDGSVTYDAFLDLIGSSGRENLLSFIDEQFGLDYPALYTELTNEVLATMTWNEVSAILKAKFEAIGAP